MNFLMPGLLTIFCIMLLLLDHAVLLMLDGHSSHYCPDTIRLATKHQAILFALPPNTTHISQPFDKGCFSPLKEAWKQVCHNFLTANPGMVVTRYQFSRLFSSVVLVLWN